MYHIKKNLKEKYEKYAAPLKDRLASLKYLSDHGCKTWVSVEPYPTPNIIEQDLNILLNNIAFANKIVFGRLHYNKIVSAYKEYQVYYNECAQLVVSFCENNMIDYHIKKKTISEI